MLYKNMNKYLLKLLGLSVLVLAFASTASASFDLQSWKYERQVSGSGEGMVKVKLPTDISWVSGDFQDLRVVDDRGVETPFVLTKDIKPSLPLVSASIINSVTANDGSTKFVVDTGKAGVVRTSLNIETDKPNFRRQVRLYSSATPLALEDSRWATVNKEGYIFSFTDPSTGASQGKNTIEFSPNTARYFLVVIGAGEEGPVVAKSVKAYGELEISLPKYSVELPVSVFNNPERKTTEVVVDLGRTGVYSDSITLNSKDTNYTRKVVVETSNSTSSASFTNYLGQGYISSIRTSLFRGSSNTINFGPSRDRYIRLSIVNDDNPVISIDPTVVVSGPAFEIVFDYKPGKTYKIYYGNPSADRPRYDISSFASYIETTKLSTLELGPEMQNSSYVAPKGPTVPFTETNKWLLNTLLVLVVLILAIAIGIYLKKYLVKEKISPFPSDNNKPKDTSGFIGEDQTPRSQGPLV
jgi:hypothetical protein